MKEGIIRGFLASVLLFSTAVIAQDDEQTTYIYATYYYCDTGTQGLADAVVSNSFVPVYDAAVEDGTIGAWGWLAHHTGGKWRRAIYWAVNSQEALIDAADAIDAKFQDSDLPGADSLGAVCNMHDDYIWMSVTGSAESGIDEDRGEAGFSTYFVCDSSRESRADEIVEGTFAPVFNKQVEAGNLASWGWLEHFVGGEYRRLATMTGADHKTVLKARDAIINELDSNHAEEFSEFDSICSSHSDYMWDIQHEKP